MGESRMQPNTVLVIKLGITGLLFWWLAQSVDLRSASAQMLGADRGLLAVATLVLMLTVVPAAARWQQVLRTFAQSFTFIHLLMWTLAANFFNQVLPSSLGGDALRVHWSRQARLPLGDAINSVVIDRLAALAATVVLCACTAPFIDAVINDDAPAWTSAIWALTPVVAAAALVALLWARHFDGAQWKALRGLAHFSKQLGRVLLNKRYTVPILANGVAAHLIRVAAVWLIADALSLHISFGVCVALVPLCLLIAMVPISIGGWGVRESVFVLGFSQVGVPAHDALALSLLFGLLGIVAALPGAFAWLSLRGPREES